MAKVEETINLMKSENTYRRYEEGDHKYDDFSKQIFLRLETIEPLKGFLEYLTIHKEINKHIISGAPDSDVTYLIKKLNLSKFFKSIKLIFNPSKLASTDCS